MSKPHSLCFDLREILKAAWRLSRRNIGGITINLPFLSFNVKPDETERRVANEVVIRLADRRILKADECCDHCIDEAIASLQDIRKLVVDKQVELYNQKDGALYLLLEMMAEGLRQFLRFEEPLNDRQFTPSGIHPSFHRQHEDREAYFTALEQLRGHLNRCLLEIAKIGDVKLPKVGMITRYETPWPTEAYVGTKTSGIKGEGAKQN